MITVATLGRKAADLRVAPHDSIVRSVYNPPLKNEALLEEDIEKALNRKSSEDDTHPSPVERFRLV